jgi:RecB family exonuclease
MARLTSEQLQDIMEKEGCSRIWSWSKINCFNTSPYEYYLRYIKKAKEDRANSIYVTTGGISHNILEKFYTNEIPYENMIKEFEDGWTVAVDIADLKFDRTDEDKNTKIKDKYYENLVHFFKNHTKLEHKPIIEQFVKVKIGGNLFQGYIDIAFKDEEDCITIQDWKTSSIYKGAKAENESGQLVLYALSLIQQGIPKDKIKIRWNFLKYVSIQYEQKNGAIKVKESERCKIGESLQSNAKTWLKHFGYEPDEYLKELLDTNDVSCLPEEIQEKYVIDDCYVYISLTDKLIDKWTNHIITTIKDIELREKDYEETQNDKCFWDTEESVKAESYYFANLCSYSANLHLPYKAYLDKLEAAKNGQDMFSGLIGSSTVSSKEITNNKKGEIDLSWLDNI